MSTERYANYSALDLLEELHAMVRGECPALLDEDRGGNSELAMAIESAIAPSAAAPVAQGEVPSDAKDARYAVAMLNYSFELNILAMQAAYIEWTRSGAEEAMKWIGNTLDGPGLIPDADEPPTAQAYFGRERKLIEERFVAARAALSTPSPAAPTSDAEDAALRRTAIGWQQRAEIAERNWKKCRMWALAAGTPTEKLGDDPETPWHEIARAQDKESGNAQ